MHKGDVLSFGPYQWRVLDVVNDRALIITESIVELRWYHNAFVEITWADCALRNYLNGEFLDQFSSEEQSRIIPVIHSNPGNPWFRSAGGADSEDRIFLLSLEEVATYFGDSREKLKQKGKQKWLIDDEHNEKRLAKYNGDFHWWRLRSPGYYGRTSASVNAQGQIYVRGNGVYGRPKDGGGVRPALWLKVDFTVN
jgi:hypothetical protein